MIKFFKNIREKSITEGNTMNYTKYSIGSILPVFIGVLIALQINTWSEKSKVNDSIGERLIILKQNLIEDQVQLIQLQQTMTGGFRYSDFLMGQIKILMPIDDKTTKYLSKLIWSTRLDPIKMPWKLSANPIKYRS